MVCTDGESRDCRGTSDRRGVAGPWPKRGGFVAARWRYGWTEMGADVLGDGDVVTPSFINAAARPGAVLRRPPLLKTDAKFR